MKSNKKAQVTLFVIIGLIILLGISLFLIYNSKINNNQLTNPETQQSGEEYRPVNNYVEQCLDVIGTRTIKQIGMHGGYLKPEEEIAIDLSKPYDAEGVTLSNSPKTTIPYWIYAPDEAESDNYVQPKISIPDLEKIQKEQEQAIDEELLDCLGNFKELEFSGATFNITKNPQTTIIYTDDDIEVKTKLPITINLPDGSTKKINYFRKTIPIPFKKYYQIAKILVIQEINYRYLENLLTNLISYYGDAGTSNSIPPFYTIQDGYAYLTWSQTDVKNKLKLLLQENTQLLRVVGTKNEINLSNINGLTEQEKKYFQILDMPILPVELPSISINYDYLNWPIYSKIWPNEGELIKPETTNYDLQMWYKNNDQTYRFYYDISYPVVVEIREDNLSKGNKYSFIFAMESNIRKNYDWNAYATGKGPIRWDPDQDVISTIEGQDDEFQDLITNKSYEIPSITKKLFNKPEQLISQPIKLQTINKITGEPIVDAKIQVGVGTYAKSIIGKTILKEGKAVFEGKGPIVRSGYLTITKEGFIPYFQFINLTDSIQEKNLGKIKLTPLKLKNVSVVVWDMNEIIIPNRVEMITEANEITTLTQLNDFKESISFEEDDEPIKIFVLTKRNMTQNETVMLTLNYLSSETNTPLTTNYLNIQEPNQTYQIGLAPGKYTISGQLFDKSGVIIPKYSKKICHTHKECKKIPEDQQYIPYDDIEMKPAIWGGVKINTSTPWQINTEILNEENNITFFVIKFPPPKTIDDLKYLSRLQDLSQQYRTKILPSIK